MAVINRRWLSDRVGGSVGFNCFLGVFFLHSSIVGVAYVTIFNSSTTWAATFHLQGYKCMLVIFVFP